MSGIDKIYTTVSGGSLHIAADKDYVGKVNSYSNRLTQLANWICGTSLTVDFDGKDVTLNKKSYVRFLHSLGKTDATVKNLGQYTVFHTVAGSAEFAKGRMMRDAISSLDSRALHRDLARAIHHCDSDRALDLIGQGAALDIKYFDRKGEGVTFCSDDANL